MMEHPQGHHLRHINGLTYTRKTSAILSLSIFAVLRAWGVSVEERREPFLGGLTAASDRQGGWKCRLCREQ